jgi:hypothetical protein
MPKQSDWHKLPSKQRLGWDLLSGGGLGLGPINESKIRNMGHQAALHFVSEKGDSSTPHTHAHKSSIGIQIWSNFTFEAPKEAQFRAVMTEASAMRT